MRALERALAGMPLEPASLAVEEGRVVHAATLEPVRWEGWMLALAATDRLRARTEGEAYEDSGARGGAGPAFGAGGGAPAVNAAACRLADGAVGHAAGWSSPFRRRFRGTFCRRLRVLPSPARRRGEAGAIPTEIWHGGALRRLREVGAQSPQTRASAASGSSPGAMTRNSSPPSRNSVSSLRKVCLRAAATRNRQASPAMCPKRSLMSLKLSTSRKITAAPLARTRSISSRNRRRFASASAGRGPRVGAGAPGTRAAPG